MSAMLANKSDAFPFLSHETRQQFFRFSLLSSFTIVPMQIKIWVKSM